MNSLNVNSIIDFAKDFRKMLNIKSDTEDIKSKVEMLIPDCIIEEESFTSEKKGLRGKIFKNSDSEVKISIDQNLSQKIKNFTLVHELGHAFLHLGFMTNKEKWKNFKADPQFCLESNEGEASSLNEFEADVFASVVLSGNFSL